jgi:hypothetical protein
MRLTDVPLTLMLLPGFLMACCGDSESPDRCKDVVCDQPPANECKDTGTLVEYDAEGTCNPDTGRCEYGSFEKHCENGCSEGSCRNGRRAAGFVTVLEIQSSWGDRSEVWAYFAKELHSRKTPAFFDAHRLTEKAREGSCVLYGSYYRLLDMCNPPCLDDQYCDGMTCQDYPPHWNVGAITIDGLNTQLQMQPDEYDNYLETGLPQDLFDPGSDIMVNAEGSELGPFSMGQKGVALLEIGSTIVDLIAGKPTTISWTPEGTDARVQVFLRTGIHRPRLPAAAIFCDVPDGDGEVIIPATLVDAFRTHAGLNQQPCEIMRYTREVKTPFGNDVELTVGSVVDLQLNTPRGMK